MHKYELWKQSFMYIISLMQTCGLFKTNLFYLMPRCSIHLSSPAAGHCHLGNYRWGRCHAHHLSPPRTIMGHTQSYELQLLWLWCNITW